ncbi:solute carrier family 12 member 4-like, partial [Passer montanus]|uniref:solute carrier family 12 member 4-like n=1 Tax=Passer montanus TaxID=9160 RepID=UPI001960EBA5
MGTAQLLVYLLPAWAVLPGRGRWGRLNNGRGYGAGLLALLGAGSLAPPRLRALATPLGPAGLLLALLALQAGSLRHALLRDPAHALCLPPRPGEPLLPCAPPNASRGPPGRQGALPALPGPSARLLAHLSAVLLLGAGVEGQLLRDKFGVTLGGVPVVAAVSWPWRWLPLLGAALSAAGAGLQALLGGSRLLRALARTRALPLPRALSRGRRWPLAVTVLTAALGVLLGSLDLLAPVLSVLCLTSYLGLNLACALQGLLPTAGWSPRWPLYHWSVSLAGALLCLSLMFVTCWHCALLALGIGATAYKYLEFR